MKEVPEESKVGRVDLRDPLLVTIDGEDARDFDDAVYCEKTWRRLAFLWVAIADVSYYVRPHTPLDNICAQLRYVGLLPSQVVRCCQKCSNGLCSPQPAGGPYCVWSAK